MKTSPTFCAGFAMQNYASGTTNRVLILIRFIYNLGRKWGVPGCGKNPATGLKTVPDVCRERFLTNQEAQRLLSALEADENRVAACAIKLLVAHRRPAQRDHASEMGVCELGAPHLAGADRQVGQGQIDQAEFRGAGIAAIRTSPREQPLYISVASDGTAFDVTALPMDAHSQEIRPHRCPAARFATLICELSRQQGGFALCGAGAFGP